MLKLYVKLFIIPALIYKTSGVPDLVGFERNFTFARTSFNIMYTNCVHVSEFGNFLVSVLNKHT